VKYHSKLTGCADNWHNGVMDGYNDEILSSKIDQDGIQSRR